MVPITTLLEFGHKSHVDLVMGGILVKEGDFSANFTEFGSPNSSSGAASVPCSAVPANTD